MPEREKGGRADLRVKICCVTRTEDARHAARSGADYLGAFLTEGYPRSVLPDRAEGFHQPDGPPLVGVLVNPSVEDACARAAAAGAAVLQLHGEETPELIADLRGAGPWALWKAVRPRGADDLRAALERYAEHVDGLLLDAWHPELRGGTGTRFDWDMVARLREEIPARITLIAAGGLTAPTVGDVVAALAPDVVDVSSGVEAAPGRKDPRKVEAFIRAARSAAAARPLPEGAR